MNLCGIIHLGFDILKGQEKDGLVVFNMVFQGGKICHFIYSLNLIFIV